VGAVTKSMSVRYCHIDYDREVALVAIRGAHGERPPAMLGVARLTLETADAQSGEFAVVVRDEYQSKGVGRKLMETLIEAARERGMREINGYVLTANSGMLRFAQRLGFEIRPGDEPETREIVLRL
jgi:acetyltransferase